jgi:hypothetical protein
MSNINEVLSDQNSQFNEVVDDQLDKLSLDEIRALAMKEAAGEKTVIEQTREEPAEEHEDEEPEDNGEGTIYYREIDLGDGSGKQRFEGKTPEEVMDKLADAQAHATRKIREQAAEIKQLKDKPVVKEQTQADKDDEMVLSQEMLRNPTKAVKQAFRKATGLDIEEIKTLAERVRTIDAAEAQRSDMDRQTQAANKFVADNPDYSRTRPTALDSTARSNSLSGKPRRTVRKWTTELFLRQRFTT